LTIIKMARADKERMSPTVFWRARSVSESFAICPFGEPALHALIDEAPDAVFVADIDGRFVYVNRAGCRMIGYSRDEILGMKVHDTVFQKDPTRLERAKTAMLQGQTQPGQWTLRRKDGGALPVEVHARILPNGQWHGFVRDVTERRAHEAEREALIERTEAERRRLQTLVDTLPLAVVLFEPNGTATGNRRVEELLGMKVMPEKGIAQFAGRILYPDGRPVPRDKMVASRVLRGETIIGEEQAVRQADGSLTPTLGSAAPILDDSGRIVGGIGVFQDVSEHMRLEQSARANERLLKEVFDVMPVGIRIADRAGRIVNHNPAAERILSGSMPVATESHPGWWVGTGQPVAPDEWPLARALADGETVVGELVRIQCRDGSYKIVINSATPLRDEQGLVAGAIVVDQDITALHQTQEQLRAAVRDREDILAVVTHDLRSPLSAMMTVAVTMQLKAQALPGGEPLRALAVSLVDIGHQMAGLVSDLLAVALERTDRSVLKIAPVDAAVLLEKAAGAARPLFAGDGIRFEVQAVGQLPAIQVDSDRILRVFGNVLDNARKFTVPPGEVVLRAEAEPGGVRYCVANSGPALSARELESMFKPFWQAGGGDLRGAGLGLSICRSIVEAHGGSIWAEPAVDKRVRICFLLPAVIASAAPAATG
jgi:PAS domain S-box-containing protein